MKFGARTPDTADSTPEAIVDNPSPITPAPAPVIEDAPAAPAARQPTSPDIHNPRSDIASRFKVQRREEEGEPAPPDDFTKPPFIRRAEEEAARAANPDEPEAIEEEPLAPEVEDEPATTYRLKVRQNAFALTREQLLNEAELTEDEAQGMPDSAIVRIAQKNMAANSYLEDARTAEKEARRSARGLPPHQEDSADEPPQDFDTFDSGPPKPASFKDLVEKVQFGDTEEAAQALQEAVQSVAAQQQMRSFRNQHGSEVTDAIEAFQSANSDLFNNELTAEFVGKAAEREIKNALVAAGLPRTNVERVITNVDAAREAYIEARLAGMKVPTPKELLDRAAVAVRTTFGMTQPAPIQATAQRTLSPTVDQRAAAKRAVPQQPQRATANEIPSEATPPKTRSDAVWAMKRFRGQPS